MSQNLKQQKAIIAKPSAAPAKKAAIIAAASTGMSIKKPKVAAAQAPSGPAKLGKLSSKLGKRPVVDAETSAPKKAKTVVQSEKEKFPDIKFPVLLENIRSLLSKKKIMEILTICEDPYDAADSHELLSMRMAVQFGYPAPADS